MVLPLRGAGLGFLSRLNEPRRLRLSIVIGLTPRDVAVIDVERKVLESGEIMASAAEARLP